jgi:hypothetical protein
MFQFFPLHLMSREFLFCGFWKCKFRIFECTYSWRKMCINVYSLFWRPNFTKNGYLNFYL